MIAALRLWYLRRKLCSISSDVSARLKAGTAEAWWLIDRAIERQRIESDIKRIKGSTK